MVKASKGRYNIRAGGNMSGAAGCREWNIVADAAMEWALLDVARGITLAEAAKLNKTGAASAGGPAGPENGGDERSGDGGRWRVRNNRGRRVLGAFEVSGVCCIAYRILNIGRRIKRGAWEKADVRGAEREHSSRAHLG